RWEKAAIYTAIALALFSAVATLSRGTYLSLIVWLAVVLWRGTAPVRKHALIYAGVVLLLILLWQPHLFLRFNTVLQNPLVSDNPPPRTEIWAYLMDTELASLPFFGVGLNRVITDRMANHIASSDGAYTLPSAHGPHNQYLAFLLTAGLIGVLVFLWIMGLTLLTAWRMPPPLSAFFTASIIGFLVQCVFEIPIPATNLPIVLLTIGAIGTCETQSPT
ncbi:MAG: O-antigen ligase family protein, partial [bacterium]|nr:O-antigen ligase family protein [bacterium]